MAISFVEGEVLSSPSSRGPRSRTPGSKTKSYSTPNYRAPDAPRKKAHKKFAKLRKTLFDDNNGWKKLYQNANEVLPSVCLLLHEKNLLHDFTTLLTLISDEKFPLDNIAFRLLLEVARWYGLKSTTQMFYSDETMLFWRVIYQLYHGSIIRFLSGDKATGQYLTGECAKGDIDLQLGHINFAVPSIKNIREYISVPDLENEVKPGIIAQALQLKSNSSSCHILSFDGKKVSPGLDETHGDIDLLGYEQVNVEKLRAEIEREKSSVEDLQRRISTFETQTACTEETKDLLRQCMHLLKVVSSHIKELRHVVLRQTMGMNKFLKDAGLDWRKSKYLHAISSMQVNIFQSKQCIGNLLECNKSLLQMISKIHGTQHVFCQESSVDISQQSNFVQIVEDTNDNIENIRFIKQRSRQWHALRSKFRITGSTLYVALGLETLSKQQAHVDKLSQSNSGENEEAYSGNGQQEIESNSTSNIYMEYGTNNECNALATLAGCVLPAFFPSCMYYEEGVHTISVNQKELILVSPDGSLSLDRISDDKVTAPKPLLAVEVKCPYPQDYKLPVHYEIPVRYVTQLLAEMASLCVTKLIYLSWSPDSSTVFIVTFHDELWREILSAVENLYGGDNPKKLTRVNEQCRHLREGVKKFLETNVEFLCEVPSLTTKQAYIEHSLLKHPYRFAEEPTKATKMSLSSSEENLIKLKSALQEAFQLSRKKATEVVVWMLSDVDRLWKSEVPHALPVCYAMQGYSLPVDTMRKMMNDVLQACYDHGIHIACTCFDGQWIKLANRSSTNKPLTLIQLRRDIWENNWAKSKDELVETLAEMPMIARPFFHDGNIDVYCDGMAAFYQHFSGNTATDGGPLLCENTEENYAFVNTLSTEAIMIIQSNTDLSEATAERETRSVVENTDPVTRTSSRFAAHEDDSESARPQNIGIPSPCENELREILSRLQAHSNKNVATRWLTRNVASVQNSVTNVSETAKLTVAELDVIIAIAEEFKKKTLYSLLQLLKGHNDNTMSMKWQSRDCSHLASCLANRVNMTEDEVVVVGHAMGWYRKRSAVSVKKSWNKTEKVNAVSKLFGDGQLIEKERYISVKNASLKEQAARRVANQRSGIRQALSKYSICTLVCVLSYKEERDKWERSSTVAYPMKIGETDDEIKWFSYPEFSTERQQIEPKCLDGHHLLTNLRIKVCKDGLTGYGLSSKAWKSASESGAISRAIVCDLIDKQNNGFARKTFSEEVQEAMKVSGYDKEAEFCELVRNWYSAEDEPGMCALQRFQHRIKFRNYLISGVDLGSFPLPRNGFINGMSQTMFEGFLQSIDTHIQLYGICHTGTYNQRAVSSLVNENFFGELGDMEPTKLGCPKAVAIPRLMSKVTELMHHRLNPESRWVYPCET